MFRVKKAGQEKYFYALDSHDSRLVKLLGIFGIFSLLFVELGYYQFLHISVFLAILFAPALIVITLYYLVQYLLLACYPGFDLGRHEQKVADYWLQAKSTGHVPRVAVFIPAAGEAVNVVEGTVVAAKRIQYPNYHVFILDDSKE